MAIRSATIDEFPAIQDPNRAQTAKRAPNGQRPPLRQPSLTSRAFIRNDLHDRTGARIAPDAVSLVQVCLHDFHADLVKQAVSRYQIEADLRTFHGVSDHQLTFQPRHVVPPTLPMPGKGLPPIPPPGTASTPRR